MDVIDVARICHEANRALCHTQGDDSQQPWDLAPAWQQESAIAGVKFAIANPDADTSAQHDEWWKQKIRDGWKFGPVKDAEAKTHPCMVPFEKLPPMQQAKDRLFRAIVRSMSGFIEQGA